MGKDLTLALLFIRTSLGSILQILPKPSSLNTLKTGSQKIYFPYLYLII